MAIALNAKEIQKILKGPRLQIVLGDVLKPSVVLRRLKPSEIRLKPSEFIKLKNKVKKKSRAPQLKNNATKKSSRKNNNKYNGKEQKNLVVLLAKSYMF